MAEVGQSLAPALDDQSGYMDLNLDPLSFVAHRIPSTLYKHFEVQIGHFWQVRDFFRLEATIDGHRRQGLAVALSAP